MEIPQEQNRSRPQTRILAAIIVVCLVTGGLLGYVMCSSSFSGKIDNLENEVTTLQQQISTIATTQNPSQNVTVVTGTNASLADLYKQVDSSVVIIRGMMSQYDIFGRVYYSQVQGSGFVYDYAGQMVIITNYHVVGSAMNITVTFTDGNAYTASVLGSDPHADLAVLSADAPASEFKALDIARSSDLEVGDPVIVVGNPYGLAGSMSTGYVSALGRTLTEETTGSYVIANVIQTTAALNPGNSGGPVLNYYGQVVGIATAIVEDSEGLGFAIPSNTILREIGALITNGSYDEHPWLGVSGTDMSYEIAQQVGTDVTYGWLIAQVTNNGPADNAGLLGGTRQVAVVDKYVVVGGDIIIAINGTRITGIDSMSAYLEDYTLPGQTVNLTIVRDNEEMVVSLVLQSRPSSTTTT
ncbi:MAG: trypsin-like peptidase domain-containing protein [Candidatus Bathyarchaeia archaeon]|jgi:S1-C subfamily serine protease